MTRDANKHDEVRADQVLGITAKLSSSRRAQTHHFGVADMHVVNPAAKHVPGAPHSNGEEI